MFDSCSRSTRLVAASLLAASALGLAAPAAAQFGTGNVRVVASSGDIVNGRTITNLVAPSIAPSGKWAAIASLDGAIQQGLLIDGNLVFEEGGTTVDGQTIDQIRDTCVSADGTVALYFSVMGTSEPIDRLRIGNSLVLEEGRQFTYAPLGLDGTIAGIYGMDYEAPNLAVGLFLRTSTGGIQRAFLGGTVSGPNFTCTGGIVGGTLLADSTSGIPYYSPTSDCQARAFSGACHTANFNDGMGSGFRRGLRSLGVLIAEHGEPGPAPNSVWNFDRFPRVRVNTPQSSIYSGQLTLSNGQDRGTIYVDGTVIAVEGGGLSGIIGGTVGEFQVASIALADDGTPLFTVPLSTAGSEVLMAGTEPVVRSGTGIFATQVNGTTVESLYSEVVDQSFDATADGRTILQRARLATGEVVLLLVERSLGDPVMCTTVPNSTGQSGQVEARGSRFLAQNDLRIVATQLPTDSFGYLGISLDETFVANPGGSAGNLCIGPTVGRFVDQVQSSGMNGRIVTTIDLDAVPQPTGFVSTMVGDRWYCQLWHRDSVMGAATSNFTDALSVEIQ